MTWYLSNSQVRPVGAEIAEFIDAPDLNVRATDVPDERRDDRVAGDTEARTPQSGR